MALVTLPYDLTNGAPADADQVMANLDAILAALNGAVDTANLAAAVEEMMWQTGDLRATTRASAATGWLLCDGTAVSRVTYAALWNVIRNGHAGTGGDPAPYGNGDASTTFNVPDLRGRVPVGVGTGSGLTARALGATGGEESHTLTDAEIPVLGVPTAVHGGDATLSSATTHEDNGDLVMNARNSQHDPTSYDAPVNTGGGDDHNTMQPFVVVNFEIKT